MRDDIRTTHALRLGLREIKGIARGGCGTDHDRAPRRLRLGARCLAAHRTASRACWSDSPMPMRSVRSACRGARRCGRPRRWAASATATMICRCSARHARSAHRRDSCAQSPTSPLPPMPLGEEVVNDYRFLRLSLQGASGAIPARRSASQRHLAQRSAAHDQQRHAGEDCRPGHLPAAARLSQWRRFMTIEDESAVANVIVWPKMFERVRPVVLGARFIAVDWHRAVGIRRHPRRRRGARGSDIPAGAAGRTAAMTSKPGALRRSAPAGRGSRGRADRRRNSRLAAVAEMPDLAADLDVTARGSAHAPNRRARS